MKSYEEALKTAKKRYPEINHCQETENAWIFSETGNMDIGGQGPVVVMKSTGKAYDFIWYLSSDKLMEPIKEFDIEE